MAVRHFWRGPAAVPYYIGIILPICPRPEREKDGIPSGFYPDGDDGFRKGRVETFSLSINRDAYSNNNYYFDSYENSERTT